MHSNQTPLEKTKIEISSLLKISISGTLASFGIILSVMMVLIPNIEFISVTIFLIALLFGAYYGLISSVAIIFVYEFIVTSIYGSGGLIVFFKLFSYIPLAIIAGKMRNLIYRLSWWELGIIGSLFAIIYDLITTLGGYILVFQQVLTSSVLALLIFGIPFTLIHLIGNFILFSLIKSIIGWVEVAFKIRGIKLLDLFDFKMTLEKEDYNKGANKNEKT